MSVFLLIEKVTRQLLNECQTKLLDHKGISTVIAYCEKFVENINSEELGKD